MTDTHIYTTKEDFLSKEHKLQRDGKEVFCHKIPPFVMSGLSGPSLTRVSCTASCGCASICKDADNQIYYKRTCEPLEVLFKLDNPQAKQADNSLDSSKIGSMHRLTIK